MTLTWNAPLQQAAEAKPEVLTSNKAIEDRWKASLAFDGRAQRTKDAYQRAVRLFLASWGEVLASKLTGPDIQAYLDRLVIKCKFLCPPQSKDPSNALCHRGRPLATCPLLTGKTSGEFSACSDYKPLDPNTVLARMHGVSALFNWLTDLGYIAFNPVERVLARYGKQHARELQARKESPQRRPLAREEVCLLIERSPIHLAALWAFLAKTGTRIHEAVKARITPELFDLIAGEIKVPRGGIQGNKRVGNHLLVVDDELRAILQTYLVWRAHKATLGHAEDYLFLNGAGRPWNPKCFQKLVNASLARQARRLGLTREGRKGIGEAITTHCFRGFFTTTCLDNDCPINWMLIMRGDRQPGALSSYNDFRRNLRAKYELYAPKLLLKGWVGQPRPTAAAGA